MKTYLEKFILPTQEGEETSLSRDFNNYKLLEISTQYPYGIFGWKEFSQIDFAPITIFYGGNGSGKSTLLNVITEVLKIRRIAPRNDSEIFGEYCNLCGFKTGWDEDYDIPLNVPSGSALLTSDDVFEYMFASRMHNSELDEEYKKAYEYYISVGRSRNSCSSVEECFGIEDYEEQRKIVLALKRSHSARSFAEKVIGKKVRPNSNGETAIEFFNKKIEDGKLYLLDEPENSLSPKLQLDLIKILEESVRYCDCQLIIATHSPLILSIDGAKIYDLDITPVEVKKWYELENVKIYFEHFYKNRGLFEKE